MISWISCTADDKVCKPTSQNTESFTKPNRLDLTLNLTTVFGLEIKGSLLFKNSMQITTHIELSSKGNSYLSS